MNDAIKAGVLASSEKYVCVMKAEGFIYAELCLE